MFDEWELISGGVVREFRGVNRCQFSDGGVGFDRIHCYLDNFLVSLSVTNDTDEIVMDIYSGDNFPGNIYDEEISEMEIYVGNNIGWLWRAQNHKGYFDCLLLGINGPEPEICFTAVANSILLKILKTPILLGRDTN